MEFDKRKSATLLSIQSTETDKSPKGTIDIPIIPLLNLLNSHPSYFTTSSCSGRISILSQPLKPILNSKKARGGSWIFTTHDPADPETLIQTLFTKPVYQNSPQSDLVLRFEPLIVAVECRDVRYAQRLVSIAISCGFRESGITSIGKRVIVAIRCSIRLEVPLGDTCHLLASESFLRYLVVIANGKMEANQKRTKILFDTLMLNGFGQCGGEDEWDSSRGEAGEDKTHFGSFGNSVCSLAADQMVTIGEPMDKLFLWGHSACNFDNANDTKILVFGGFGGMGKQVRRNDCLVLDPISLMLKSIDTVGSPSTRLGHTSSMVGNYMFVIGGRVDPTRILNDVWVLDTSKNEWKLLNCTGCSFPPRHRHAATVIGSKIYVFGGITDDTISSSLHVLDTDKLQWDEICIEGKWPCARHSHSLVTYESQLYMFGGYTCEKTLGDFYSFNIKTCSWKNENIEGIAPYARFSHSMFVYKNYIGIIGGCPIRQHCQEVSLLDMRQKLWKSLTLNTVGKDLFVRSTANVVGDDLVIIGGGASCYAFGTTFSEPVKISLLPLVFLKNASMPLENEVNQIDFVHHPQEAIALNLTEYPDLSIKSESSGMVRHNMVVSHWMLKVEKKYAKLVKDILKKFGWLDLCRKVNSSEDGICICFPISREFCAIFVEERNNLEYVCDGPKDDVLISNKTHGVSLDKISLLTALNILNSCGATRILDSIVKARKSPKSLLKLMGEAVSALINHKGLPDHILEQLPTSWKKLGDIVVLPVTSFKDPVWDSIGHDLWPTVAKSLSAHRLAREGRISPNGTRDSTLEILVGDDGWVDHRENGIHYSFDATKCMFSWGNLSEKLRMGNMNCVDEIIVDLFAGIGYFVLPFLVRAKAKLVYACEWNPHAIEALRRNLQANSVADRCIVLEGDNRLTTPKGVANRVCLGLIPTSEGSWVTAVRALSPKGGMLHVHGNVKDVEEASWATYVANSVLQIAKSEGYRWEVSIEKMERVKWYAPHVRHLVIDLRCTLKLEFEIN